MTISILRKDGSAEKEGRLVQAAQQDPAAFTSLYDRYVSRLYRYLYSRTGSPAEAEDLTAQTILSALESLPNYRHRGYFSAWLFTIARSKLADFYRKNPLEMPLEKADHNPGSMNLVDELEKGEQIQLLSEAIRSLDEDKQDLLRLRYTAGLTFAEIGETLGRSEDAVKKALYRLLDRNKQRVLALDELTMRHNLS